MEQSEKSSKINTSLESYFKMVKSFIKPEYITIIKEYAQKNRAQKSHKAKYDRIEGRNRQFDNIVRHFNASVSIIPLNRRIKI